MKAIAVVPGMADSAKLVDMPEPALNEVPNGRGVLVKVLQVGVDGTDREINQGQYGTPPPGEEFLILGHEGFGVVEAVADDVSELSPGDYVVAMVRRPGNSRYDIVGMPDLTTDDNYLEHGINRCHGFLRERYVDSPEYLVKVPDALRHVGALLEPTSVVEKGIAQAYEIQRRLAIWAPRRALVLGTGPLGLLATLALRLRGLDVTAYALLKPPNLNADMVSALGGRYVSAEGESLDDINGQYGPFDLIFEAAGYPPLSFEAMRVLGKNGILVLSGVAGGDQMTEVPVASITREFALWNKAMVGTVNANRGHFEQGIRDLAAATTVFPGWLPRLITHRVSGLNAYDQLFALLDGGDKVVKVVVDVVSD